MTSRSKWAKWAKWFRLVGIMSCFTLVSQPCRGGYLDELLAAIIGLTTSVNNLTDEVAQLSDQADAANGKLDQILSFLQANTPEAFDLFGNFTMVVQQGITNMTRSVDGATDSIHPIGDAAHYLTENPAVTIVCIAGTAGACYIVCQYVIVPSVRGARKAVVWGAQGLGHGIMQGVRGIKRHVTTWLEKRGKTRIRMVEFDVESADVDVVSYDNLVESETDEEGENDASLVEVLVHGQVVNAT